MRKSNEADYVQPRTGSVRCVSGAGLHRMAYTEWGDPANPHVLVCVHGLTRSGRDFDALAARMSSDYRVVCPDVVGRGQSDRLANPAGYGVPQYVADMITLIARLDVETVDWFGTSMGGLIGLAVAGLNGTPISRLLLNDVGPHIEPDSLDRIGEYLGVTPTFASEQEGIDYLASLAVSFGPHSPDEWRALNAPLLIERDGAWHIRYDPGIAVPFKSATPEQLAAGEGLLWQSLERFEGPMLVVRGADSDLLTRATVDQMKERGQHISSVEIAGVGHAPTFVHDDQIRIAEAFFLGSH
jgi:pimeloyl-ACP methyl ester carboxylesterase